MCSLLAPLWGQEVGLSTSPVAPSTISTETGTLEADSIVVDLATKEGVAVGSVTVHQASTTITGDHAIYNWQTSTGSMKNATGHNPPWHFRADELDIIKEGTYDADDLELTSCNENPPHYYLRSNHAKVRTGVRATATRSRLVIDQTPVWWMPFYTRSLVPKKYHLRLEPGSNSRDGLTNRTSLRYPFTPNTSTKFIWDWRERTGNGAGLEHRYYRPDIKGSFSSYYIKDVNPDPTPAQKKYSVLWNHYQQLTPKLTTNARFELKNPQEFGNEFDKLGSQILVENAVRGVLSEAGFNYQFANAALRLEADRRDRFDNTVSSKQFISKLTLPRITYNTVPLKFKYLPFYTNFTATYLNETVNRTNPQQSLKYQKSAAVGTRIQREFRVKRKWTFTPSAGYDQSWQDRDFISTTSVKDVYLGRPSGALSVKRRLTRNADANVSYSYAARFRRNNTKIDTEGDDHGVEREQVNTSLTSWLGAGSRLTLSSGYDLRDAPRTDPSKYSHESERYTPPSLDVQWAVRRNVSVFFRETYSLFDTTARTVRRTPLNTAGEIQFGNPSDLTMFSQGFTYVKPSAGQTTSDLIMTNKLKFYLTRKWYLDFFVSYRALADKKLNYHKVSPIERTVRIVRDLHCWILRMEFSSRPGRTDASFYIDLKVNGGTQNKNLFEDNNASLYTPGRDQGTDPFVVFPVEPDDAHP